MRCPWCGADDDRVVDSRPADGGSSIRRRRQCNACGRRFSTYERIEDVGLIVRKRDGSRD
ncbi:MAG TPA: transcriptional regulator NrdR, partial [Actinomycetota bacterium]|nr:transcriptional regulator NrdR [Actinomycetota bacterium]